MILKDAPFRVARHRDSIILSVELAACQFTESVHLGFKDHYKVATAKLLKNFEDKKA